MGARDWLRRRVESCGYSVHRWPANRFDGMRDALTLLRQRGYAPRVIIDGGANIGAWSTLARSIFGDPETHMVEPQPACRAALDDLIGRAEGLTLHPVALTESGVPRVRMIGGGEPGGGTGARVARAHESAADQIECPATTLDALFADRVVPGDRALLKLDLEGHELAALRGAERLLPMVEVLVSEVQFLQLGDDGPPVFAEVVATLLDRGFELYDVAGLSPRPRDLRLRLGDIVFVNRSSRLLADRSWE